MTTLYIGRAGRDVATMFIDPERIDFDGNSLSMAGTLRAANEDDVLTLRQQMLGLSDSPDEPVVPIVFSGLRADSTLDGFYRVESVTVQSPNDGAMQAGGGLRWSGEFERVVGYGSPQIETIATFPVLTNGCGVTGAEIAAVAADNLWFPESVTEISHVYGAVILRTAENGVLFAVDATTQPPTIDTVRWSITAADYYDSAVTFQVGTSFRTFVGRQLENSIISSALDDWRIDNGLVRVSWDSSDDTLVVQHFDGSGPWETAKKYDLWIGGILNNQVDDIVAVRILVNTPERVTVRLALASSNDNGTLISCDLTVLRGERMVRLTITSPNVAIWGIARATNEAGTDTSATAPFSAAPGLRATSIDADGNRYVIASSAVAGVVTENTIGAVDTTASIATALFMISTEIGGSGAAAHDTAEQQILSFLAGTNQQQIVSVR